MKVLLCHVFASSVDRTVQNKLRTTRIETLLRPESLAFVGVSARGGSGAKMLKSAQSVGFNGPIWPVNPKADEIGGLPCFKSLGDLPSVPDCVVVAVPAPSVLAVLEEAAALGVPSALVVSEGFADAANDEGRARQRDLIALAEKHQMAIAGPNCMGIGTMQYRSAATMADVPRGLIAGGISLISQSGGLLNAVAELSANRGVGLNYFISIGNQAVLDMADYIDFMVQDEATKVIALIMEGAKNGRRFRAAIERASRVKPIVVLKLGRSEKGQAATLAHTGTLAGKHEAFAAIFKQAGVALVDSIDELIETAALFAFSPLPAGDRVCMLTVSGGATSLISDLGENAGIHFPPVSPATNASLKRILDVERQFGNPVDTVGMPRLRKDDNMSGIVQTLLADDGIDVIGLVLGMRMEGAESHQALIDSLAQAAASATKPLMVVSFISNSLTGHWRDYAAKHGLPLVEDLERGMKAIRHLIDYAAMRRTDMASTQVSLRSGSAVPRWDLPPGQTLTEAQSKAILSKAGLPVTKEFLARTPAEAAALFADIGGKVVLKVQSPDIPHKSDVGGVYLGARNAEEVEKAATQILANALKACPTAVIDGLLVAEMVEDGTEFILGMTYDEQFGPMIVCGAGGVTVEVFKDVAVRLPPLSAQDARTMLYELKASKFLDGFRGAAPRDVDAFIDCIVRFSDFVAASDGEFAAIDLNPVFICAHGKGVRIADALIVTNSPMKETGHA
jgi:acetyltransferase